MMTATWRGTFGASGTAVVELEYFMKTLEPVKVVQCYRAHARGQVPKTSRGLAPCGTRPRLPGGALATCGSEGLAERLDGQHFLLFVGHHLVDVDDELVGQLLHFVGRAALVVLGAGFVLTIFFSDSLASRRMLRTAILASSASPLTSLTISLRRSSVSGGVGTRIWSPCDEGFRPRSASRMARSMAAAIFFSNGCTPMVRASIRVTLATCVSAVGAP